MNASQAQARVGTVVRNVVRLRQIPAPADEALSDEALVALAARDRQAFGVLYDRYVDAVYRYCAGRLGDREAAEDATSLVFTRALAALPSHRGPSFRSWLFAIAHNVVVNARRDAPRARSLDDETELTAPDLSVEEIAERDDRRRSVRRALALLPEEQRRVVELRLAGLTGPEVAAALGRSHDSVRTTQRRAVAALRTHLGVANDSTEGRDAS
jgi:RNA polymerase sigma-70 factor (ECF subfamily)